MKTVASYMCPVYSINVFSMLSPLAIFWYQILLSPICLCIHFQLWFYFTWPHFLYTNGVFAWDIITFVRFMHCCKSRIFESHIAATLVEVDQDLLQSMHFLLLTIQLVLLNFNLKQEMHYSFIILIQHYW